MASALDTTNDFYCRELKDVPVNFILAAQRQRRSVESLSPRTAALVKEKSRKLRAASLPSRYRRLRRCRKPASLGPSIIDQYTLMRQEGLEKVQGMYSKMIILNGERENNELIHVY